MSLVIHTRTKEVELLFARETRICLLLCLTLPCGRSGLQRTRRRTSVFGALATNAELSSYMACFDYRKPLQLTQEMRHNQAVSKM